MCLVEYNGKLYGGTSPNGKLYEWNGADAWAEKAGQLGSETSIKSLAVYNNKLYGGTSPSGKLYEWDGSNSWIERVGPVSIHSIAFFNGKIYGGTSGGELYEWDSTELKWVRRAPKLGSETDIICLAEYNGKLYGGTSPNGKLYEWNGADAWAEKAGQLNGQTTINSLAVLGAPGNLYAGTSPGGRLFQWNGATAWTEKAPQLGAETSIKSLAIFGTPSKLYGGTSPNGKLYEWNGADAWVEKAPKLGAETSINELAVYNSKLYGGTGPNGRLYEWDGAGAWTQKVPVIRIMSLVLFTDNKVYGGTSDGRLLQWDSVNQKWLVVAPQTGTETSINCLAVFGAPSKIYAGTSPNGKLYQWDGSGAWIQAADRGALTFTDITSLTAYNGKLYAGTNPGAYLCSWVSPQTSWTQEKTAPGETAITALTTGLSTKIQEFAFTANSGGWTNGGDAVSSNNQYASHTPTSGTLTNSPTQNSGSWTTPNEAYVADMVFAQTSTDGNQQTYYGYNFAITADKVINLVRVRLDGYGSNNQQEIRLEVSTDDGSSWLPTTSTTTLTNSQGTYWIDVTGWTTWTPTKVNSIRTRVTFIKHGGGTRTIYLDWIPVEVTYNTAPATHTFTDFNQNPAGETITKVEVGVEGYTVGDERLNIRVSWDGGTSWSTSQTYTFPTSDPNTLTYFDFTGATTWTTTKLNNANFRVEVTDVYQGAPSNSYIDYICTRVTSTTNELYASTSPNTYLYTLTPSNTWTQKITTKYSSENAILSLKFLNNNIYGCSSPGGYLLMRDTGGSSTSWTKVTDPPATQKVVSLLTDGTDLYGGTTPNGYLYKLTGSAWTPVVTTQYPGENSILSMVFDSGNNLKAGTDINGLLLGVSGSNWVKNAGLDSNGILSLWSSAASSTEEPIQRDNSTSGTGQADGS